MASGTGSSGSFSKFSLIKARLRSDAAASEHASDDHASSSDVPPPPMRTGGQYVASIAFRPTPPPSDDYGLVEPPDNPSAFRPATTPSEKTGRMPSVFSKAPRDGSRPPQPDGGPAARPPGASSALLKGATPSQSPGPAPTPRQKSPAASQKPADASTGKGPISPIILRSRGGAASPVPRASTIADQVTRALAGYVGGTLAPKENAPPVRQRPMPPPSPAPPPPAPPASSRSAASVEAFLDGKTDGASLKERELAVALRNLQRAGWTFQTVASQQSEGVWVDGATVYRFLLDEKRVVDTTQGDRVRLFDPRSERNYTASGIDEVAAIDYFFGTGDPASLRHAALAKRLQALTASGLVCEGDDANLPGLWGAYVAMVRGERAVLKIEGVIFGEIRGTRPADVDQAIAPLNELIAIYRNKLMPEATAGRLRQFRLGSVLQTLSWDVPQVTTEQRADAYLRLLTAVCRGPEAHADLAEQTIFAARAYEAILELDLGGGGFWEAVATMETLVGSVGSERAKEPLHVLYRETGMSSHFAEARQEREQVFRRVLACGLDPHDAIAATQQIVVRAWDEPLETRVQLFEALADMAHDQPGYTRVLHDFGTVVRYRSTKQLLEDAARPYLAIFEVLATQHRAEDAAPTFALLHEGVRLGHLDATHASPGFKDVVDGLAHRFVELFKYSGDVAEARQRLLHWAPGKAED